jgi:hypothetical protein
MTRNPLPPAQFPTTAPSRHPLAFVDPATNEAPPRERSAAATARRARKAADRKANPRTTRRQREADARRDREAS